MQYIEFDKNKKYDLILVGRVAVDFNPVDYYCPLNESTTFKRYLGGSPANIAVGLSRLGKKCGFFARVSDDFNWLLSPTSCFSYAAFTAERFVVICSERDA